MNSPLTPVDLRTCKPGQKLRSVHGAILEYVGPTEPGHYYDHYVKYGNGGDGTRTHNGQVCRKNRLDTDHDIVEIL